LVDLMDHADVRVVERGGIARAAEASRARRFSVLDVVDDFQCDAAVKDGIVGEKNRPNPADAQQALDSIAADCGGSAEVRRRHGSLANQRLDFSPQRGIAAAGGIQEGGSLFCGACQHPVVDLRELAPLLGIHTRSQAAAEFYPYAPERDGCPYSQKG